MGARCKWLFSRFCELPIKQPRIVMQHYTSSLNENHLLSRSVRELTVIAR